CRASGSTGAHPGHVAVSHIRRCRLRSRRPCPSACRPRCRGASVPPLRSPRPTALPRGGAGRRRRPRRTPCRRP
ncbi:MAG: hypothetical protein FJX11_25715, partial [Alphaproteobacteria bacterium]|nr:hypothetical protein [Alphaproteobacteria bacterium]